MARGRKYTDRERREVLVKHSINMSVREISETTNIPDSTIRTWINSTKECDPETLVKLREDKNKEFEVRAWDNINRVNAMIAKRVQRADEQEKQLDELIQMVADVGTKMDTKTQTEIITKLKTLKIESMGDLTKALGVLYDKQALASGSPTDIHGGAVQMKFEDL